MKIATAAQIKAIDTAAINQYLIPGIVLMENAAVAAVNVICASFPPSAGTGCVVICGRGNNGGDGFAIARHLYCRGFCVKVVCLHDPAGMTADTNTNFQIVRQLNIPVVSNIIDLESALSDCDFIVDALYGIGFRGSLREKDQQIADLVNQSGKAMFAIDIPSGINADTGQVAGAAVKADKTITFTAYKPAQFLFPAADYCGEVVLCGIGIPRQALEREAIMLETIESGWVGKMLPRRRKNTHKGDYGKVLIVAGSVGMSGAAYLSGVSAARSGAGLVTVCVPASINGIMEVKTTEVMSRPLPDENGVITPLAADTVVQGANSADVMLFGPGLTGLEKIEKLLKAVLPKCRVPVIIDADGLNVLAKDMTLLSNRSCPVILTPHTAEMARLTGSTPQQVEADRIGMALRLARQYAVTVVLKGAYTVVACEDGRAYINHATGNAGMATGGSGDVLAGTLCAMAAAGLTPSDAAVCAVYLHGLAGDIASKGTGLAGMLAGDISTALPQALRQWEKS